MPVAVAAACAAVAALTIGHFLLGIPVQYSDSFGNMLKLDAPWGELIAGEFRQQGFLRPMLFAPIKAVYDLSGGSYGAWFRGVHAVQAAALIAGYVALVRPRSWIDAAILPFGLSVLLGTHTFAGAIVEAFPVNTFLTILLCCFLAALLALSEHRWWKDVAAALILAFAALTVETGLLVAVVVVTAFLAGARGVSRAGVAAVMVLVAGYLALRFVVLDTGTPGLAERVSGFGFSQLSPAELQVRFGANPLPFYAYNVLASLLTVLFAEPSGGVFGVLGAVLRGEWPAAPLWSVAAATSVTALVAVYVWRRRADWCAQAFTRDDRLVLIALAVLFANAVVSYPYVKDVVMSPASAFMAAAALVSLRHLLAGVPADASWRRIGPLAGACLVIGALWSVEYVRMHTLLRRTARVTRIEWAYAQQPADAPAAHRALFRRLRDEAIYTRAVPPPLALPLPILMYD